MIEKDNDDFYITYKGELSSRCKECCDYVSKDIEEKLMQNVCLGFKKNDKKSIDSQKRANGFKSSVKKNTKKYKTYIDYIDADVKAGRISKSDGAYYKRQNISAKVAGTNFNTNRIAL